MFKCFKIIEYKIIFAEPLLFLCLVFYSKLFIMAYMHFCNFAADFHLLLIPSSIQAQFFFFSHSPQPPNHRPFYVNFGFLSHVTL